MSQSIQYVAVGGTVEHYGMLPEVAARQWDALNKYVTAEWKTADSLRQKRARLISSCLDKLSATLLQAFRLKEQHDGLITTARNYIPIAEQQFRQDNKAICMAVFRGNIAIADFEALLLQARASLDALTRLASEEYRQSCTSFRKLKNVLGKSTSRNRSAQQRIIEIIDCSEGWFDGLLTSIGTDRGLRDFVAHSGSATTWTNNCFAIKFLSPHSVLLFDCELGRFPVFQTTSESVQHVSHVVLNTLSVLASQELLNFAEYCCQWKNLTGVFSKFVMDEPDGSPLTDHAMMVTRAMTPDGFQMITRNVQPRIYEKAIDLSQGRSG